MTTRDCSLIAISLGRGSPMRATCIPLSIVLTALLPCSPRADELRVADVFTDNAVLQQGTILPVWGTTTASEKVTVRFAGQTQTVQAAEDGSWRIELSPLQADGTGSSMIVESGEQRQEFRNLLVGEVWYASGQSNMQMTLSACARKITAIRDIVEAAPTDSIRTLRIDEPDSPQPLTRRQKATPWQVDNRANRGRQSAVAYFFARELHDELGVPIGIMEGSWGGKPIEGFIPRPQFEIHTPLRPVRSLADQGRLAELAAIKGGVVVRNTAGMPGRIFNARIASIAPYALRGFIWYQGESNAGRGEDPRNYRIKMQALVDGLRLTWSQPELPFYFVQLPAYKDEATGWVRLREEQRRSLSILHTGMAVTIDLRDSDIHPANKVDVGKRLARWALAKTYGKKTPFSGPLFKSAFVEKDSMRVEFEHAEGGLIVARKKGLTRPQPTPDVALAHFELADESGKWHAARATINGTAVRVHSPVVPTPRAVRYACSGAPADANLYNHAGLPASPFCSELQLLPGTSGK
jgi:sialate O-acetylesterase